MIDATYCVVGLGVPDMTREEWIAALAATPAEGESGTSYDALLALGVSHLFMRYVFQHESSDGTRGICPTYRTKSPGNCRSSSTGAGVPVNTNVVQLLDGVAIPPAGQGIYIRYPSWTEGWRDAGHRLLDPDYPYAKAGAATIAEIIPIWAPPSDNNDPRRYIAALVAAINGWLAVHRPGPGGSDPMPTTPLRVVVAAGHHNTSGGSPVEYDLVDELCEAYVAAFRRQGADVRSYTPDGVDADDLPGDGNYAGTLYDAARQVVAWAQAGWSADLFAELHTQGGPKTRGMFGIYPDDPEGGDIDVDARDRLIPEAIRRMSAASGIPVWTDGVMSERQTNVWITERARLGVFRATAELRATCTRLIVEHGAHDTAEDLAILRRPETPERLARAFVEATYAVYGLALAPWDAPAPVPADPDYRFFPETGHGVGHGFRSFWETKGGLEIFGYPLSEELDEDGLTVQYFERAIFEWHPANPPEWRVLLRRLGAEALARKAA